VTAEASCSISIWECAGLSPLSLYQGCTGAEGNALPLGPEHLTRYCFLFKSLGLEFVVLSLLGALSDERPGLSFVSHVIFEVECRSYFTTDSQSVCLGIEHPCGTCDQILLPVGMLLSEICGLVSVGRPL
jgi:hypothetical protein